MNIKEKRRESEKEKRLCLSPVRLYAKKSRGGSPLQTDCTKQGKEAAHIKRQGFYSAARLHHENKRQDEALPSF